MCGQCDVVLLKYAGEEEIPADLTSADVEQYDYSNAFPTDAFPMAQSNEESSTPCQQPRKGDGLAVRGQNEGKEHHHKDAKSETTHSLNKTGNNSEKENVKTNNHQSSI